MTLSEELKVLATELLKMSKSTELEDEKDHETVYGYYYSKGALDYRDKLLDRIGEIPRDSSVMEAFYALLETFPSDYPGPSS